MYQFVNLTVHRVQRRIIWKKLGLNGIIRMKSPKLPWTRDTSWEAGPTLPVGKAYAL